MDTERECPVCHKKWMVQVPERGALPIYCSRACSAKAARARARARQAGRDEAILGGIDDALAELKQRHVARAIHLLEATREILQR